MASARCFRTPNYLQGLHGLPGLGLDRLCGFTGTVLGPGFFGAELGHFVIGLTPFSRRGRRLEEQGQKRVPP